MHEQSVGLPRPFFGSNRWLELAPAAQDEFVHVYRHLLEPDKELLGQFYAFQNGLQLLTEMLMDHQMIPTSKASQVFWHLDCNHLSAFRYGHEVLFPYRVPRHKYNDVDCNHTTLSCFFRFANGDMYIHTYFECFAMIWNTQLIGISGFSTSDELGG